MINLLKDRIFYRNFLILAIPMALQNMITTSVNLVDNIMIGQLGAVPIAAVGLANKIFFIFAIIVFGVCGGSNAFIIQYWGKKDLVGIKKVISINLIFAILIALLFFFIAFFFPEYLMTLLSNDPAVIKEGISYLKVISLTYLLSAITFVFSFVLKSLEHPRIPLFTSLLSIGINVCFNYVFIFGKFGFPAMGVKGAAIATLIARIVECFFIVYFTFTKIEFLRKNIKDYFGQTKEFFVKYLKTTLPVTANETFWSIGTTVMAAIYARVSTEAIASVNIVNILYDLSSVFLFGASHAAGIMVGKEIGAKRKENAYLYARRFVIFVPIFSGIIGFLIIPFLPYFLKLFKVTPEVKRLITYLYTVMAFYIPFRAISHVNIVGCLRAGGDALFCLLCDVGTIWGIGVLFAYLTAIVFKMPMEWVYILSQFEEFIKAFIIILRIRKNNWIKDLVNTP